MEVEDHKTCAHQHSCCLSKEPAPLSQELQTARSNLAEQKIATIKLNQATPVNITKNMFVGDILRVFPQTTTIFQEIDPLGYKNPSTQNLTIEMLISGTGLNADQICAEINQLVQS